MYNISIYIPTELEPICMDDLVFYFGYLFLLFTRHVEFIADIFEEFSALSDYPSNTVIENLLPYIVDLLIPFNLTHVFEKNSIFGVFINRNMDSFFPDQFYSSLFYYQPYIYEVVENFL